MLKVAIIGANGQVGAELCLMLADRADLSLVPICRNRSGSAFLRWQGIPCRHGRIADAAEAPSLIGDCDVVVNCSLAAGTPAEIRRIEDRIARNVFAHSMPQATIIHFSTQSVYGDPAPGSWIRWRSPYGRAKLATEWSIRREARRTKKPAYILRLGHVCGSLQEISNTIRTQLGTRTAVLPARDCSSNTVYTAAIVDALLQITGGKASPGTFDLMNTPRWSWREVYTYEGETLGLSAQTTEGDPHPTRSLRKLLVSLAGVLVGRPFMRDLLSRLFVHVPDTLNARGQAWWYKRRANGEIAELRTSIRPAAHLSWVENGNRFFPAAADTIALLKSASTRDSGRKAAWPLDLPHAEISGAIMPSAAAEIQSDAQNGH